MITKPAHIPTAVYTKFFDCSHCPGDARVTGIPTTKMIDSMIKPNTNIWIAIFINIPFVSIF